MFSLGRDIEIEKMGDRLVNGRGVGNPRLVLHADISFLFETFRCSYAFNGMR